MSTTVARLRPLEMHRRAADPIPRIEEFDSTVPLLFTEGYRFISDRCSEYDTDVFRARIMLRKAVCTLGEEAAEQFYWPGRFTRKRALPLFALTLIQDLESVMVLNDEDHRRRKAMFMEMMSPVSLQQIGELTERYWRKHLERWQRMERVVLFHEAHVPLTEAICAWAGLHPSDYQIRRRAREFEAMVEGTGSVGPRNWRGHWMRSATESWARETIRGIRRGEIWVPERSPAHLISWFRDRDGRLLDVVAAGVELLNVLRPSVAISRYAVFIAIALHVHPEWRERMRGSDDGLSEFVDEVRRFFPFIPVIGGRVIREFEWRGHEFKQNDWVMFDIYGTNRDPRIWRDPEVFRPERFKERGFGPYDLVSHGAGDRRVTHRCPGEWVTVEQMKAITRMLVREMDYRVPTQDLRIDLKRIPAVPRSKFVMTDVQARV
jgi:fatty-acid peroxygenase